MARRSPIEVDARRHALRDLLIERKHRGDRSAYELLASTADGLAREAANLLARGDVPTARRYARAHRLITESRSRLYARQDRDRTAQREREAAEHGIQAGETVRVTKATGSVTVRVGDVVTVARVHGGLLFIDQPGKTLYVWGRDVERVTVPEPTTVDCGHLRCKQLPDGCEMYDAPRTVTAIPAGRDRDGNPITRRVTYVIDRRPEPFGEGRSRIFSENRTIPKVRGDGFEFTPDVVLTDSIEQTSPAGEPR